MQKCLIDHCEKEATDCGRMLCPSHGLEYRKADMDGSVDLWIQTLNEKKLLPLDKAIKLVTEIREEFLEIGKAKEELLIQHGTLLGGHALQDAIVHLLVSHRVDAVLVKVLLTMHECKEK